MLTVRRIAVIATGFAALLGAASAFPQEYPARAIRLVVPAPPGGPTDVLARVVGAKLTEAWKQPVVVENRPGANQIIGTAAVAKAAPDGYTLLMVVDSSLTMVPHAMKKVPYDARNDFEPISTVANAVIAVIAHPSVAGSSLQDALNAARAAPGKFTYGSGTLGSQAAAERVAMLSGTKFLHVPYKGAADVTNALLAGDINFAVSGISGFLNAHAAGRVKILAVSGERRAQALPDVPTLAELGYPGFDVGVWLGMAAPAGTPRAVVAKISEQVNQILELKEVRDRLNAMGLEPMPSTPEKTKAFIEAESQKWASVIKQAGITLE